VVSEGFYSSSVVSVLNGSIPMALILLQTLSQWSSQKAETVIFPSVAMTFYFSVKN